MQSTNTINNKNKRLIKLSSKTSKLEKKSKKEALKLEKKNKKEAMKSEKKKKSFSGLFVNNKKENSLSVKNNSENQPKRNDLPNQKVNIDSNVEIKCVNIEKTVKELGSAKTVILKNINLEINKGEITVILGPSGSGKTTLLNVIAGIDKATSGQCYIKNTDINTISDKKLVLIRRKYISYIYQRYGLIPILSCYDNIRLGQHLVEKSKRVLDINEVIKIVGIEHLLEKFPHELSGGQRQRVAIARAIMKQPEVMLCDEPTAALDSETSKKIIDLFLEVNKKFNTTIVMVTHEPSFVRIATKVVYIKDGEIEKIQVNQKTNNQINPIITVQQPVVEQKTQVVSAAKPIQHSTPTVNVLPNKANTTNSFTNPANVVATEKTNTLKTKPSPNNAQPTKENENKIPVSSVQVKVLDSKLNKEVSYVDNYIKNRKLDKYVKKMANKKK
ncbi:ABC transporter ATP-binding protein [Malacoplasma penetrans]|uniref:ABC transporter ATP-binding protein n=1 Tax=Malacoplasma penetrans TaxID=28227 RepID=UPI001010CA01|nr:ABC transporter ATP-binding protein [Malacoplasma penetrans]RXY96637.1 ABC transporter ATP-binding protein [Malacoplasma penetrans]